MLWDKLLELGADRKTVIVAVGGGVVGDLAGFVAATFARGLPFVQVPTTLLAQVDSSVGGKVGINLPGGKNMVGAFWQPAGVLIDTAVLATLPEREYRAGLAEVVKYGVILDADFFAYLEDHVDLLAARDTDVLEHVVTRSCRLKADVVEQDEREETGRRSVLNYGHTFCHALETVTGYGEYLHGEAVAIGMLCASRLAERLGRVDASFTERQHALLAALGLPVEFPDVDQDAILAAMSHDKKVEHGQLRFVLPTAWVTSNWSAASIRGMCGPRWRAKQSHSADINRQTRRGGLGVNRAALPPHDDQPAGDNAAAGAGGSADAELVDAVRLSLISGVGPRLRKALLEEFGAAAAVLAAAPSELRRVQGIGPELTRRIAVAREEIDVQAELDLCSANGVTILTECDPAYPRGAARNSRSAGRPVRARRDSCRKMRWPWPSSARGTPRTTDWRRPSGWPAVWPGPA